MSRLSTLKKADPAEMDVVQKRYKSIADTIDDAVTRLQKIVDSGDEGLRGEYVGPLRKDAASLKESLSKASRRYRDVAVECAKYKPELERAIDETKAAERQEEDGGVAVTRAKAMPEPQQGPDGTISPEEQQKGLTKERELANAQGAVTAAKSRLNQALDALDVAGKAFGDAVNQKKYKDGLTDKVPWRVMGIFKWVSKVLGIIALALAVLALFFPGAAVIAIASLVVSVSLLAVDVTLLHGGKGSVLSVVLDVFGVGLGGLGLLAGKFAKLFDNVAKLVKGIPAMSFKITPGGVTANGHVIELVSLGRPVAAAAPKPGFFSFSGFWNHLTGGSGNYLTGLKNGLFTLETQRNLSFLRNVGFFANPMLALKTILGAFGASNQSFNIGAGIIVGGMQVAEWNRLNGV